MAQNPFTFGHPVNDQALFIGRKIEIRQIVNRLVSSTHESTSLVGDSRMGNTSLLKYLSNPISAADLGLHPDLYLPVYIDFQRQPDLSPHIFWKRVITSMFRSTINPEIKELAQEYRRMDEYDLFDLEDFFEEINDFGITIILFMDEFEYVTQSPNISEDFFGGLRSLAIHSNLSMVPATRREIADLVHSEDLKGSPFFNIFASVYLRPFSSEESNHMLENYLSKSGIQYTEKEKDYLAYLGDGHPYFLQMAGYYWFIAKELGLAHQELTTYIFENYYQQSIPHLENLWSTCDQDEKSILITVATSNGSDHQSSIDLTHQLGDKKILDPIENLIRRGLLAGKDGEFCINLPCLEKFLQEGKVFLPQEEPASKIPVTAQIQKQTLYADFDVFISYSTQNKDVAFEICTILEKNNIRCWIAPRDIPPGTLYGESLINAIKSARIMILVLSEGTNQSDYVVRELNEAVANGLTIISFRIEEVEPSEKLGFYINSTQWMDAIVPPLADHIDKLVASVEALLTLEG